MQGIKSISAASHYLLSRDGDIIKRADKKELHDAKQEELYWLIVGSVHVAALKTIVKKIKSDPLRGSKAYATVMAAKTSAVATSAVATSAVAAPAGTKTKAAIAARSKAWAAQQSAPAVPGASVAAASMMDVDPVD